jgi:hypothetical protein
MLSSSPAVPLHSIDFHDGQNRRLSLRTHGGQEYLTAHDGLPDPEHLTPVSGTPRGHTPEPSDGGSAPLSRRGSDLASEGENRFGSMASLNRAPSRRTNVDVAAGEVSLYFLESGRGSRSSVRFCDENVINHTHNTTLFLLASPVITGLVL